MSEIKNSISLPGLGASAKMTVTCLSMTIALDASGYFGQSDAIFFMLPLSL